MCSRSQAGHKSSPLGSQAGLESTSQVLKQVLNLRLGISSRSWIYVSRSQQGPESTSLDFMCFLCFLDLYVSRSQWVLNVLHLRISGQSWIYVSRSQVGPASGPWDLKRGSWIHVSGSQAGPESSCSGSQAETPRRRTERRWVLPRRRRARQASQRAETSHVRVQQAGKSVAWTLRKKKRKSEADRQRNKYTTASKL